jgi:hypothetical protein
MTDVRTPTDAEVSDPRQLPLLKRKSAREPAEGTTAYFEQVAARMVSKALTERVAKPKPRTKKRKKPKVELGNVIRLPVKAREDPYLRLEQNLGCELPVCVSNRRDVKKEAIEVTVDGTVTWRLERTASSLLPAPEHHSLWLWFLDRCHAAARAGHVKPPRIVLDPTELHALFGGNKNGEWYKNIDEAFWRFSHLVVEVSTGFCERTQKPVGSAVLGTLCHYASWRRNIDPKELENAPKGWVAPGPLLWESILAGYLKAIPMQTMWQLPSYVAQRLFAYLSKHCRPDGQFKISLVKLLPKIPLDCPINEAKKRLRTHHKSLVANGFLSGEPMFEGRGSNTMVTYERPSLSPP